MTHFVQHGSILGSVCVVPDLKSAITDYRDILGLDLLKTGMLEDDLAQSWACPDSAGQPTALLRPSSVSSCVIRLVEQPDHPDFKPTTTFGWAAIELTVQDVFGWPKRLKNSGFTIAGPPKELAGMPYFVPMQVLGSGQEMVYLNEVRENTPSSDLPKAQSLTDHIFIVILAAKDRKTAVKWYCEKLGLNEGDTYNLAYSMINSAFGLPKDTMSSLTMVQKDRLPILEIDDYPDAAKTRPQHGGMLPPGNAMVTLGIKDFTALSLDWITKPVVRSGPHYQDRLTGTIIGPSGELLELIEVG